MTKSGGDACLPLSGALGRHFVFPAPFQTGQFTTHAPAAVMAEISSPLDGVDFGLFAHRGLPRLHRSSEAVGQRSLQPGGVPLGLVTSRVMVTTDASTRGRGAVCEGMPASGLWSEPQSRWHINRFELEAVVMPLWRERTHTPTH